MSDSEMSPASKTSDVHRLVRCLEDVKPHMIIRYGFTRYHIAETIRGMVGGKRTDHERLAGRILAKARSEGEIGFINGRTRSTYYRFTPHHERDT